MKHVVMFSGGLGSWVTAKRIAERRGTDDLHLVFADVGGQLDMTTTTSWVALDGWGESQ